MEYILYHIDLSAGSLTLALLGYSTTWDLTPKFPLLKTRVCRASLPEWILWITPHLTLSNPITSSHDLIGEMTVIFQALRILSNIMSQSIVSLDIQYMFTRGLYICEYQLLVVLDQTDHRFDDFLLDRNSHIYGSTRLAAYLYLYLALRELPRTATICVTLARRLKRILEGDGKADLLVLWGDDKHLLNWIAFMGALVLEGVPESVYFLRILKRLRRSMRLETEAMFKDALKEVLWMDDLFFQSRTWIEISGHSNS